MAGRFLELGLVVIVIGLFSGPGVNGNRRAQITLREVLAVLATLKSICQYKLFQGQYGAGFGAKYRMLPLTVLGVILRVICQC